MAVTDLSGTSPDPAVTESRAAAEMVAELAGLDALETFPEPRPPLWLRAWSATWPKLMALAIAVLLWQCVVWSGWRPEFVLPGPATVFETLRELVGNPTLWDALGTTLLRGAWGFLLSVIIGVGIGLLVAGFPVVRTAVGSLITGLQTMPSIAWFPLAILLFKLSEAAILFVVVLGAAPSVANGLIHGIDHVPPVWKRAGRVLGARGLNAYWFVILPAAGPSFVAGLKQGWAFAWRSLMAGELIVVIANKQSIGGLLQTNRDLLDSAGLLAIMIVILVVGIIIDSLLFGTIERRLRRRWGLMAT